MNLKKQLRLYLAEQGLTASELSRLAGVPKQSLSDWLAGTNPRDIRRVKRVADALQISLDHLLFGDGLGADQVPKAFSDDWMTGVYEVKFRKIKNNNEVI